MLRSGERGEERLPATRIKPGVLTGLLRHSEKTPAYQDTTDMVEIRQQRVPIFLGTRPALPRIGTQTATLAHAIDKTMRSYRIGSAPPA